MTKMEDVVTVPLGPKAVTIYERIIAHDALQRGLAVFAPTSKDRESGCWTQQDLVTVEDIVEEWTYNHDLNELPRMGMGDSSGASYLFFVFKTLKLKSMAVYNTHQIYLQEDMKKKTGKAIPTVFVSMKEDEVLAKRMAKNHEQLASAAIATKEFHISPLPFTSAVCYPRFPELENDDCDKLYSAIKIELPNLLDRRSFVKQTLTTEEWDAFFGKIEDLMDYTSASSYYVRDDAHKRDQPRAWINEGIQQEIKACQGFHSMSSEHHTLILDFLIKEALPKKTLRGEKKKKEGKSDDS
ncbi:MAG: hypothetical protein SGBAC_002613 [Bacillariaceae sp.]